MGLLDYMPRNPVRLPIPPPPPSEYDKEFKVAAINTFINNLENVILNQLANQNKTPCDLIKKRAENKGLLDAKANAQLTTKHSKHSGSGQLLPKKNFSLIQTLLKISQQSRIQKIADSI